MIEKYYRGLQGQPSVVNLIKRREVLVPDHFRFKSGRHSDVYFAKDRLMLHSRDLALIRGQMVDHLRSMIQMDQFDGFIGAAHYGIPLTAVCAVHCFEQSSESKVMFTAEKGPQGLFIRRGLRNEIKGKRLVMLDDVLTMATTVDEVASLVTSLGGSLIGLLALINRHPVMQESLKRLAFADWLVTSDLPDWEATSCPLCAAGIELNMEYGHAA